MTVVDFAALPGTHERLSLPATGQWQASLCASGEREHVAEGRGCSIEQAARRMAEEAKITSRMLNDRLRRTNV